MPFKSKAARNDYLRRWRESHSDRLKKYQKGWRASHYESALATAGRSRRKNSAKTRAWRISHKKMLLVGAARIRARQLGVAFSISVTDLKWPDTCPVLGLPLKYAAEGRASDRSATLDRIVPELGYTSENVRVICWRANRLKNDATLDESIAIAIYLDNETARMAVNYPSISQFNDPMQDGGTA